MIKHIVMWRFKDEALGADRQANAERAKAAIESLKGVVPGLLHIEAGIDIRACHDSWDLAIYSEFTDRESLDAYQVHPDHVKVAQLVGEMREVRGAVDYEV